MNTKRVHFQRPTSPFKQHNQSGHYDQNVDRSPRITKTNLSGIGLEEANNESVHHLKRNAGRSLTLNIGPLLKENSLNISDISEINVGRIQSENTPNVDVSTPKFVEKPRTFGSIGYKTNVQRMDPRRKQTTVQAPLSPTSLEKKRIQEANQARRQAYVNAPGKNHRKGSIFQTGANFYEQIAIAVDKEAMKEDNEAILASSRSTKSARESRSVSRQPSRSVSQPRTARRDTLDSFYSHLPENQLNPEMKFSADPRFETEDTISQIMKAVRSLLANKNANIMAMVRKLHANGDKKKMNYYLIKHGIIKKEYLHAREYLDYQPLYDQFINKALESIEKKKREKDFQRTLATFRNRRDYPKCGEVPASSIIYRPEFDIHRYIRKYNKSLVTTMKEVNKSIQQDLSVEIAPENWGEHMKNQKIFADESTQKILERVNIYSDLRNGIVPPSIIPKKESTIDLEFFNQQHTLNRAKQGRLVEIEESPAKKASVEKVSRKMLNQVAMRRRMKAEGCGQCETKTQGSKTESSVFLTDRSKPESRNPGEQKEGKMEE